MKPPKLALDRDLLGDIQTRIRHPRPAERVCFQSAQGHMPCPHLRKPFMTCAANAVFSFFAPQRTAGDRTQRASHRDSLSSSVTFTMQTQRTR